MADIENVEQVKSENVAPKEVEKKPKKKHKLAGLWVALTIIFALVIAPVLAVYIALYDANSTDFIGTDTLDQEAMIKRLGVDSLDNCKTEAEISFRITQDDLNEFLYLAASQMPSEASQYVKKFYVEIGEDTYTFFVDAEVPMFKTRIQIETTISEEASYGGAQKDTFVFTISNIQIGRIANIQNKLFTWTKDYISDSKLNESFANAGLSMKSDLAHKRITYKKDSMFNDLKKLMGESSDNDMFSTILDDLLKGGFVNLDFNDEKALAMNIGLTSLHTNINYCNSANELNLNVGQYRDKLVTLMNRGVVNEQDMSKAFSYLVYGYDNSSADVQSYIAGKNLSSIGISNYTTYKGADLHYEKNVKDSLTEQITPANIMLGKVCQLTESEINDVIKTTNLIGFSYLLDRQLDDGTYKVNYITIDNFYSNIVNGKLYLVIGIDINGYETSICVVAEETSSHDYTLFMNITDVYYGTNVASDDLKVLFYDMIDEAVDNEDWFVFDKANGEIQFTFEQVIDDSGYRAAVDAAGTASAALIGSSLADDGYVDVTVSF